MQFAQTGSGARQLGLPFNLPFVHNLDLTFEAPVTFLVGENGCGKSTLIVGIADRCQIPGGGGGRNELAGAHSPHCNSELAPALSFHIPV